MHRSLLLGITEWPSRLPAAHLPTFFKHGRFGLSGRVLLRYSLGFDQSTSNIILEIVPIPRGDSIFVAEQHLGNSSSNSLQTRHLRISLPSASQISFEVNQNKVIFPLGTISVAQAPWLPIAESTSPTSSSDLF